MELMYQEEQVDFLEKKFKKQTKGREAKEGKYSFTKKAFLQQNNKEILWEIKHRKIRSYKNWRQRELEVKEAEQEYNLKGQLIKHLASGEPTPINTAQYELNHSLITTSRPLHGTIYHSTAGGTVQSTFCTLTWPGLAKWSRGAGWDVFHPWCSASRTEKCLRNATPQIYTPQSKMGWGRALLSAMPATSSRWEVVHRREHPGAVPSCAQVCTLLITPGRAKEA